MKYKAFNEIYAPFSCGDVHQRSQRKFHHFAMHGTRGGWTRAIDCVARWIFFWASNLSLIDNVWQVQKPRWIKARPRWEMFYSSIDVALEVKQRNHTPQPDVPSELRRRVLEALQHSQHKRGNSVNYTVPFFIFSKTLCKISRASSNFSAIKLGHELQRFLNNWHFWWFTWSCPTFSGRRGFSQSILLFSLKLYYTFNYKTSPDLGASSDLGLAMTQRGILYLPYILYGGKDCWLKNCITLYQTSARSLCSRGGRRHLRSHVNNCILRIPFDEHTN